MKHKPLWTLCLILVLPFLTSCASTPSAKWKEHVEACRQRTEVQPADAPGTIPAYVPYSIGLLGIIREWMADDDAEWGCIADL
jgi:hypothetical protein